MLGALAGLAATTALAREGDVAPIIEITAEVVTVDKVGLHLVDRTGGFWVVEGGTAHRLALRRGTMVTVQGVRLPDVNPPTEQRIEGRMVKILEAPAVHVQPLRMPKASFAANGNRPVLLKGQIIAIEWRPSIHIHMTIQEPGKGPQPWMVEIADPALLMRLGQGPETLKPGAQLIVRGYSALDPSCKPECRALARDVSVPDGRRIYMDGGRGAPRDGADASAVDGPAAAFVADESDPVTVHGEVISADWTDPHVHIHLVAEDGQRWVIEGGTRNTLLRGGITRDSLSAGRKIILKGVRARDKACDPECRVIGRDMTFTDARRVLP